MALEKIDIPIKDILPITSGGTGADNATEACANIGALPLSGGVCGKANQEIVISQYNAELSKLIDDQSFDICGGTISKNDDDTYLWNGAYLSLYGKDHSVPGHFVLGANNCTKQFNLTGKTDGSLTWKNENVITSSYTSSNTNSIITRFSNGLQIVSGNGTTDANTGILSYTFPVPFNNNPNVTGSAYGDTSNILNVLIRTISTTQVTFLCVNGNYLKGVGIQFNVIGRWK